MLRDNQSLKPFSHYCVIPFQTSEKQLCINDMIRSRTPQLDDWTSVGSLEPGYFFGAANPKANGNWKWPNGQSVSYKRNQKIEKISIGLFWRN